MGHVLHVTPALTIRRYRAGGSLSKVEGPLDVIADNSAIYRKGAVAKPICLFRDWPSALCAGLTYDFGTS